MNLETITKLWNFFEESLAISRDIGDKSILILSLNNLGSVNQELGDPIKATGLFEEALAIGREIGEKPAISNSLYELGTVSLARGDYLKALEYVKDSFEIRSEAGDKRGMSYSLNSLADINFARGEYTSASEFYKQSLKISRELGDKSGIASSLTGLSAVLLEEGELEKSLNYLNESIEISRNAPGNKKKTSLSLYYLGWVNLRKEKFEDAGKYFTESLILRKELGNGFDCVFSILAIAVLRIISKNYKPALKLLSFVKLYVESNKLALYKTEQTTLEKSISELKEKLSREDFFECIEAGKLLNMEEAIELAIGDLEFGNSDLEF
ncbi:MAG: tetratricopeptide repeat protein [Ignavibacteria bacterium]|nr:tetratricopeptide repeat protein [Ignavibacteria bacterium]